MGESPQEPKRSVAVAGKSERDWFKLSHSFNEKEIWWEELVDSKITRSPARELIIPSPGEEVRSQSIIRLSIEH